MAPSEPTILDCRACGLCCKGREGTVLVAAEDLLRWRSEGREDLEEGLVPGHFGQPGLAVAADGCCVHQGTPESALDCAIYALRPRACADFPIGGAECLAIRQRGRRLG